MDYDSEDEQAASVFEAFKRNYTPGEGSQQAAAAPVEEGESFYPERSFFRGNISAIPPVDESANVFRSFNASGFGAADEDFRGNAHASFSYGDGYGAAGAGEYDEYDAGEEGDEEIDGPVVQVAICEGVLLPVPLLALPTNKVHTLRSYVVDRILEQPTLPRTRRLVSQLHEMKLKQKRVTLHDDWDLDAVDPDAEVVAVLPEDVQRLLSIVLLQATASSVDEEPQPSAPGAFGIDAQDEDEEVDGFGDSDEELNGLLSVAAGRLVDEREEFHGTLKTRTLLHAAPNGTAVEVLRQYSEICNRKHADLSARTKANFRLEAEVDEMRLERNTWKLFYDLHKDGFVDDLEALDRHHLENVIQAMPDYLEPTDIINVLYRESPALARWRAVVSWLEQTASQTFLNCDEVKLAWSATAKTARKGKVDSLDPDAQVSAQGLYPLEGEDNEIQEQLMQNVWTCIRSGRLDLAQQFCDDQKYHWLAAVLAGCLFTERDNEDQALPQRQRFGNLNRAAWLLKAWRYAEHLSDRRSAISAQLYESAVFAALSGNLDVLLRSVHLETWEDQLWAYFKVLHDRMCTWAVHVYNQKRASDGDMYPGACPQQLSDSARYLQLGGELDQLDADDVFERMEAFLAQAERPSFQSFYQRMQKSAVLGPAVLQEFMTQDALPLLQNHAHIKRFVAHLGIYLHDNLAHVLVASNKSAGEVLDELLMPYIDELEQQRHLRLVALYAWHLTDDRQLERFSDYMTTITASEERAQLYQSAQEVFEITTLGQIIDLAVTKMIDAEGDTSSMYASSKDIFALQPMGEADQEKIHALEWLQYNAEFFDAAIIQTNRLIRLFIIESKGKKCILNDILQAQVEHHVVERTEDENLHALEFGIWHQYSTAVFAVQQWRNLSHKLQRPGAQRDHLAAFEDFATDATVMLKEQITAGFFDIEHADKEASAQLQACKQIILQQSVVWLQRIYFETGNLLLALQARHPSQLQHWWQDAVKVAELVASDKYKLLDVVSNEVIREVLKGVHASSMTLLKLDEQDDRTN